jgi:alanine dehydrogenase
MIYIDFDAVHRLASVGSLVEPLRRAFASHALTPERAHYDLSTPQRPGTLLLMPAWRPDGDIGVKVATVFPDNAHQGLPSVNAAYLLLSGQTGESRAYIDGRALTLVRTAAVGGGGAPPVAPQPPPGFFGGGAGGRGR